MNAAPPIAVAFVLLAMPASSYDDVPQPAGVSLDTSFTYQGRLFDDGAPVSRDLPMTFRLYDLPVAGVLQGTGEIEIDPVTVTDGIFTVTLDFGPIAFPGAGRFLEIEVDGETLAPRQQVTSAPYAVFSQNTRGIGVASNGFVGIGTDVPFFPFHVTSDDDVATAYFVSTGAGAAIRAEGRVGLGTGFPDAALHVVEDALSVNDAHTANDDLIVEDNDAIIGLFSNGAGNYGSGIALREKVGTDVRNTWGIIRETGQFGGLRFTYGVDVNQAMNETQVYFSATGGVGIGTASPQAPLDVSSGIFGPPSIRLYRSGVGGQTDWVEFETETEGVIGSITSLAANVSYNAFTGSHYAWSDRFIAPHTLVRMTGDNRRVSIESTASEPIYGVAPTTRANDPACLGARGGDEGDRMLVEAVGNGSLLVTRGSDASNVEPGDRLVSSDIAGCAMKDDAERFATSYVVARAAEHVDWSTITPDADGIHRATISVLFDSCVIERGDPALRTLAVRQQTEIDELRARLESLELAGASR